MAADNTVTEMKEWARPLLCKTYGNPLTLSCYFLQLRRAVENNSSLLLCDMRQCGADSDDAFAVSLNELHEV
jgi:hypothetical protein